ncbi:MAG: DegV family protein [Acidimicrobiales bacterium]|jgi:DegV family protein with EDD domain
MASIRVVTDSAADLDPALAKDRGVAIVALDVRLGDIGPEVTGTWTPQEFWQQCAKNPALPETSAPSPGAFVEAFTAAADDGADGVVCITLSSKLSATYQAASAGAQEVADRIPIRVVDSLSVTMGEGIMVLDAARAARDGAGLDEIAGQVTEARDKVRVYGALDTLDNLRKGGRIGSAQAFFGSLLAIKPVIEIRDGIVEAESRQRTRSRSLEYLADKALSAGDVEQIAVVHADAPDVDTFVGLLSGKFPVDEILVSFIGPVIGTHSGAGGIGVCFKLR